MVVVAAEEEVEAVIFTSVVIPQSSGRLCREMIREGSEKDEKTQSNRIARIRAAMAMESAA
jgi:hypothetical protein